MMGASMWRAAERERRASIVRPAITIVPVTRQQARLMLSDLMEAGKINHDAADYALHRHARTGYCSVQFLDTTVRYLSHADKQGTES